MITRTWPALCAWGAGLVHIATAAGATTIAYLVILLLIGVLELAWGVMLLRFDQMPRPGLVLGAVVVILGVSVSASVVGVMGGLPLFAVSVQLLIVAIGAAVLLRRARPRAGARTADSPVSPARSRAGRTIAGFALGAALVSGITTPALAATEAGEHAVPHGQHSHFGH